MINNKEIEAMIKMCENSENSLSNVRNLASLYIVQEHTKNAIQRTTDSTERELNDILPQYKEYCEVKRKYQLRILPETAVHRSMQFLCKEIEEFIKTLYNNTETKEERQMIENLLIRIRKETC